jgi:PIN domain nuclease of toxin-antitoxin system
VRILLDTHVFLWLVSGSSRLNSQARTLIKNGERIFVSSATIWEISIKVSLGKLKADPDELIEEMQKNGFEELPVYARYAKEVARLPLLHGDPFDRLLVAQAKAELLHLVTCDTHLSPYSDLVVTV